MHQNISWQLLPLKLDLATRAARMFRDSQNTLPIPPGQKRSFLSLPSWRPDAGTLAWTEPQGKTYEVLVRLWPDLACAFCAEPPFVRDAANDGSPPRLPPCLPTLAGFTSQHDVIAAPRLRLTQGVSSAPQLCLIDRWECPVPPISGAPGPLRPAGASEG
jgi:hypothetical protein